MKTIISAFAGLALILGTAMAQTPAPSASTTNNSKPTTKVRKHKKHNKAAAATTTSAAPAPSTAPAK